MCKMALTRITKSQYRTLRGGGADIRRVIRTKLSLRIVSQASLPAWTLAEGTGTYVFHGGSRHRALLYIRHAPASQDFPPEAVILK